MKIMKKLIVLFAILALVFTPTALARMLLPAAVSVGSAGGCSGNYGEEGTPGTAGTLDTATRCSRITLDCAGTPSGMRAYIDDFEPGGADDFQLALYDDSTGPVNLLGYTVQSCGLCDAAEAWSGTISWSSGPGALSAGDYWVCITTENIGQTHWNAGVRNRYSNSISEIDSWPNPSDFSETGFQRDYLIQLVF